MKNAFCSSFIFFFFSSILFAQFDKVNNKFSFTGDFRFRVEQDWDVQNQDGSLISIMTGLKRILPTLLGAGNVLVLFDRKNKLSFQDRLTNTEVVCISLAANKGKDWVN